MKHSIERNDLEQLNKIRVRKSYTYETSEIVQFVNNNFVPILRAKSSEAEMLEALEKSYLETGFESHIKLKGRYLTAEYQRRILRCFDIKRSKWSLEPTGEIIDQNLSDEELVEFSHHHRVFNVRNGDQVTKYVKMYAMSVQHRTETLLADEDYLKEYYCPLSDVENIVDMEHFDSRTKGKWATIAGLYAMRIECTKFKNFLHFFEKGTRFIIENLEVSDFSQDFETNYTSFKEFDIYKDESLLVKKSAVPHGEPMTFEHTIGFDHKNSYFARVSKRVYGAKVVYPDGLVGYKKGMQELKRKYLKLTTKKFMLNLPYEIIKKWTKEVEVLWHSETECWRFRFNCPSFAEFNQGKTQLNCGFMSKFVGKYRIQEMKKILCLIRAERFNHNTGVVEEIVEGPDRSTWVRYNVDEDISAYRNERYNRRLEYLTKHGVVSFLAPDRENEPHGTIEKMWLDSVVYKLDNNDEDRLKMWASRKIVTFPAFDENTEVDFDPILPVRGVFFIKDFQDIADYQYKNIDSSEYETVNKGVVSYKVHMDDSYGMIWATTPQEFVREIMKMPKNPITRICEMTKSFPYF